MAREIYDAKKDAQFQNGYIDIDEMRVRSLEDGTELSYRYMHGGFEGTSVRFSFCFPQKEDYEGRFYQYLSPFPGPEEELASLPVTGVDDKLAFCFTHGAYYVESNMGSAAVFTNSDDHTITHRSSAASAEFSRIKAQEVYGYEHRPYGYVYGGSGGGYRTIACIENTNAFDGAVPFVIGCPYAIPNCQTTRAHAERLLRNKMEYIVDAEDAGGSQNPYENLSEEEAEALKEATLFGYPLKSWFASADLNDGALPVLMPGIKAMDPQYFEDFWKVEGYLGEDVKSSAVRDRICMDTQVHSIYIPGEQIKSESDEEIDTRNGVNDAWKKMIRTEGAEEEPWVEVKEVPLPQEGFDLYLKGCTFSFGSDGGEYHLQVGRIEGHRIFFTEGFGMDPVIETLCHLKAGDTVHLDNSDYIAIQTYHRHQVPSGDYKGWAQFCDADGNLRYPQREILAGPVFTGNGPGCEQNGKIQGKVIIVAALMDEQAYPWQADWYRRKIASVYEGDEKDICRLWYFDNALHDNVTASVDELHATSYMGGLRQALVDLATWVEKGKEPLASSRYTLDGGCVTVSEKAVDRGGLQPVAKLKANGSTCASVKAGETVEFTVEAEVPDDAGMLTKLEWSFEGEQDFPEEGEWKLYDGGQRGTAKKTHIYKEPGTYFGVVRISSERKRDKKALFTQIRNIERVRVVVR